MIHSDAWPNQSSCLGSAMLTKIWLLQWTANMARASALQLMACLEWLNSRQVESPLAVGSGQWAAGSGRFCTLSHHPGGENPQRHVSLQVCRGTGSVHVQYE